MGEGEAGRRSWDEAGWVIEDNSVKELGLGSL